MHVCTIANTRAACIGWECGAGLFALSYDSGDRVDAIADAASAAGGKAGVRGPMDMGWLYNRAIEDPDGHILEQVWVDVAAMVTPQAEHV